MAKWNPQKRVLNHEHTRFWRFELRDVDEPNLQKEVFPYDEVSRIDFDHRIIPIQPAEEIFITDTTFRDGQQARPPYTTQQIVDLYQMMSRLGGYNGIIRQTEFFLYSNRDKEAVRMCQDLGLQYPEITGWIRAAREDIPLVKEAGLKETGILTSVSDYHIFLKLNMTRSQALEEYLGIVKAILDAGIVPRCHFEDITRADIYGFCIPFAIELMKLREESGVDIKIRLCDTMGYGVTYPGASLPRGVDKLVRAFIDDADVPGRLLEWHGHNDFHKALINATTAWLYGCSAANSTLLGLGERTGNPPIEGLIIEYIGLMGKTNGIDTTVITDIANYFKNEIEYKIPSNYPFVGADFNVTRAGVHADGLIKSEEIYNIFNTTKILKRPIVPMITDKSGKAGIAYWINSHFGLSGDSTVDKRHPGISKINKWIADEYELGRVTTISTEELEAKVRKYMPELFMSDLERIKFKAAEAAIAVLRKIIDDPAMKTMQPELQEPVMQRFIEEYPSIQFAYVVDMNGKKTTRNITNIVDRAKYENYGVGTDQSDREWFIKPLQTGKLHVTDFYISKMTGALCFTVSEPITDDNDDMVGIFGVDIRVEDLVKEPEYIAEATQIALKAEYDAKYKSDHWL
ncbi:triose-phosphate isomerase [Syntrophus aciditrophicus]|uniref:Citrate (Re)-synthase n=1 Tax=Syntrophus aciditrophicus (strain SB) TaxID=56780 RepID=CIRSY_SYNAS|nr:histone-lysine N-methyltransferase [Syntrophus aciditrophicus]Q2LTE1.2 RecName: Full=Citrate (Re)-synthase; AltName: Full=Re-citrate synthase [Syntrophus aciditrophicus SB]ABC77353.2 isopropylmalate/homocitrate/citramalate synthases [Syntrophus aciditrophicus SB]OPY17492.1 MAG: 2-isopropylmalate synthase [Syntrophus sp. PtaB.Bin075]